MGIFYQEGLAMPVNLERAIEYIKKAASNCEPHALYEMGRAREEGRGIRKRLSHAYAWYQAAADQGLARGSAAAERVLRKIPCSLCGRVRNTRKASSDVSGKEPPRCVRSISGTASTTA